MKLRILEFIIADYLDDYLDFTVEDNLLYIQRYGYMVKHQLYSLTLAKGNKYL